MTDQPKPRQITDAKQALDFLLGGNARLTLKSTKTQARYTYRVSQTDFNPSFYYVSYLTGSDNENDYAYIGMVKNSPTKRGTYFELTAKSKLLLDSLPIKAFTFALNWINAGTIPETLEVWHEGRCCRCGRTLTVPESIASGWGPECAKRREGERAAA